MTTIEEIDRELAGYLARLDELEAAAPLAADRFAKAKEAAEAFEDTGRLSAEDFVRERNRLNEARDIAEIEHKRIPARITALHEELYFTFKPIGAELIAPLREKQAARKEEIWTYLESLVSSPADRQYMVRSDLGVKNLVNGADDVKALEAAASTLERYRSAQWTKPQGRTQLEHFASTLKTALALL